jgi:outer membrane receptor protein involved in Fe transport
MRREARHRYRPTKPSVQIALAFVLTLAALHPAAASSPPAVVALSPLFVTATRGGEANEHVPFSHATFAGDTTRSAANVTIDGMLRQIPGFSLFRRSDSLVANPSTQGVSLRGLGPSGASRSLILLDGVPLTDPFGGWVLWSKAPRESLARIEIVPGAGGTAWGNAALGGVIQLITEPPNGSRRRLAARGGSFGTVEVEAQFTEPVGPGTLQLLGRTLSTDGYHVVAEENRGPIDIPATSRSRWATARWRQPVAENVEATLTVRRFAEKRGNGTPYQTNSSDETFASLAIAAQTTAGWQWNATAYAQSQNFTSTFSAVNPARTAETPASHQFAVPATTLGFAWVAEWGGDAPRANGEEPAGIAPREHPRTTFGFDVRDIRGETREDSAYADGAFTRRRFAGGRQTLGGVFLLHRRPLLNEVRGSFGVRADGWRDTDGHRRDYLRGELSGDERYRPRDGVELSPTVGVTWPVRGPVRVHASAQQAFRRPTLNELYRAFRVGNVITDGNPALRTERVMSGEIGVTAGRGGWTTGVTGFWNELHDSVANVTIARGPVTLPGIGFVPEGGEGRRKHNLDRTRVRGVALEARWRFAETCSMDAQYLYNDARVTHAAIAPWLEGRRLAQVPEQSASAGVTWARGRWRVAPRVRWVGEQFEDDNNRLRLAAATVVDVAVSAKVGRNAEMFASVENVFDRRIETGRSSAGLVNVGMPRLVLLGLRLWR